MSNLINKLSEKLGDKNEKAGHQHQSSSGSAGNSGFDDSDDYSRQAQQRSMAGTQGGHRTRTGGQSRSRETNAGGFGNEEEEGFEGDMETSMRGNTGGNKDMRDWKAKQESIKFQQGGAKPESGYENE